MWTDSDQSLTAFVGSGGTYGGTIRAFKELNPKLRSYVVEPDGAAALTGAPVTNSGHPIPGGGYSMPELRSMESIPIDGYIATNDEFLYITALAPIAEEGVFSGYSAGANAAATITLLEGGLRGTVIGVVICDSELKYLSTDL